MIRRGGSSVPATALWPLRDLDQDRLLALNNAHALELSRLTADQLAAMLAQSFFARGIGDVDAALIAFDQSSAYAGWNFGWFRARYDRFVYVDRVVVAPEARGRGLARALYAALFAAAVEAGHTRVGCEVNSEPPNPASDTFHAALGFAPVGSAVQPGDAKTVRYLMRALP